LSIPITLQKEVVFDHAGQEVARCGFKIGGGIDQVRKIGENFGILRNI
jgi:hypothetical protein